MTTGYNATTAKKPESAELVRLLERGEEKKKG